MNRIVRDHYPVAKLPEDLRDGLQAGQEVRVTIEATPISRLDSPTASCPDRDKEAETGGSVAPGPISRFKHVRRSNYASIDEVVRYVRTLRDE